jgi:hypothetical protein
MNLCPNPWKVDKPLAFISKPGMRKPRTPPAAGRRGGRAMIARASRLPHRAERSSGVMMAGGGIAVHALPKNMPGTTFGTTGQKCLLVG